MSKVYDEAKGFKSILPHLRYHLSRQQRYSQNLAPPQATEFERRFLDLSPDLLNQKVLEIFMYATIWEHLVKKLISLKVPMSLKRQSVQGLKRWNLRTWLSAFIVWLLTLVSVWPWASHLTSLCFNFLFCKNVQHSLHLTELFWELNDTVCHYTFT